MWCQSWINKGFESCAARLWLVWGLWKGFFTAHRGDKVLYGEKCQLAHSLISVATHRLGMKWVAWITIGSSPARAQEIFLLLDSRSPKMITAGTKNDLISIAVKNFDYCLVCLTLLDLTRIQQKEKIETGKCDVFLLTCDCRSFTKSWASNYFPLTKATFSHSACVGFF